ncbi:glycoside hydrolase family 3 N-terminal domain-containing protein [Loigolactobacillus coryniformis]|uniref:Beta-glucosidase n=1 Tax=Loigolactobacillus coryniformis TaxID=1610 RepID=A0A5B8TFL3_9LACO|nr:glycoside hydrolase family 3 N-terminal domain-containing protein [Loigolactobacillus coryniformis]QEA53070.1 beta-glucosidase [Loigolactobacillus coryniformis]
MGKKRFKKAKRPQSMLKKIIKTFFSVVAVILMLGVVYKLHTTQVQGLVKMGTNFIGYKQSFNNSATSTKKINKNYYKSDYSKKEMKSKEKNLSNNISDEGTILLKNSDNLMPFKKGTKFSFISANSVPHSASGITSLFSGKSLKDSFTNAGFQVNSKLWSFYSKGAGKNYGLATGSVNFGDAEDFSINEAPLSALKKNKKTLDSIKNTVPVFVLKRVAGEGRDMPRSMANEAKTNVDKKKSYLEPDSTELTIIKYLNDHYKNVVVLVNANAAINLDWLKAYPNIKSVVYAPTISNSLGKIFSGKINPSARTVDTFAVNASESPAAQNVGDYQYYTADNKKTKYNYVSYAEGIYVGYRYYETRYEDSVLKQGNAGQYNYNNQVVYPFGYGLSYTKFDWKNYQTKEYKDGFRIQVDITNTGKKSGKDVLQVYSQSPYTDYDKKYQVEKPSVQLAGYQKTKQLKPGETQRVSCYVFKDQLKSYDANKAKTYILEAGKYYLTAAQNAHVAVNNILSVKGKTSSDGMTASGNSNFVSSWAPSVSSNTVTKLNTDSKTGAKITNQFSDAKGDVSYLTRNNWVGTFPKRDGSISNQKSTWGNEVNGTSKNGTPISYTWKKTASKALLQKLSSTDADAPKIDTSKVRLKYSQKNGLSLIDLRGKKYSDPQWNKLLDQISPKEYQKMIDYSGYGIDAIKSVNKPYTSEADSASGLIYGGTGMTYPNSITMAQTWNTSLAKNLGNMIGNEANIGGASGWYAPSMNIHRTPFTGRNGEYFSEDGYLSGRVASLEVKGAAEKGVYSFIKHFALNDQENHRGDRNGQYGLATWSNEQAIRELYLKPFEMSVKVGKVAVPYYTKQNGKLVKKTSYINASTGVMTAFNRIGANWAGGYYPLLTNVLRNEWGFKGMVMTDNANTSKYMDSNQMIKAGGDVKLINAKDLTDFKFDKNNKAQYYYARQAAHNVLYTTANSKAMNGALPGAKLKVGIQTLNLIINIVTVLFVALSALLIYFTVKRFKKPKQI